MQNDLSLQLRPEQPSDCAAIDEIVRSAFWLEFASTSEVPLVQTLRERDELVRELTLVALEDNVVVGYIAMSEVTRDGASARGLGLAPVAVDPQRQGAGIGSALIEASLAIAVRAGWQFVVLLGHAEYYPRFGFVPAREHGVTGDYGDGDGWMVRALTDEPPSPGHVRYCSAFQ